MTPGWTRLEDPFKIIKAIMNLGSALRQPGKNPPFEWVFGYAWSGGDHLLGVAADLHLAGLGPLGHRHSHGQHAVLVAGLDLVGVVGVTQVDPAVQAAGHPLADDVALC